MSPKRRLPPMDELETKYMPLLENSEMQKVENWSLPNCSEEFDEEKNLAFMEKEGKGFTKKVMESFQLSPKI